MKTAKPIRIAVSGCCGKMGQRLISLASQDRAFKVAAAIESASHSAQGKPLSMVLGLSGSNLLVSDNLGQIKDVDALIEFTNPEATCAHLSSALKYKKPVVIGTTGLDLEQLKQIKRASRKIPIVFSPNMSLGVNLMFRLVRQAAEKLTEEYQADIIEAHHVHKQDAPSGTAKRLAEVIKQSRSGKNRQLKIDSIREGEIVGDHQVRFTGPQDVIILKHSAKSRDIFAQGALEAARFIVRQKPGLYDMQDVISAK